MHFLNKKQSDSATLPGLPKKTPEQELAYENTESRLTMLARLALAISSPLEHEAFGVLMELAPVV